MTSKLASTLGVKVGATWAEGGQARHVVGIVQNPQSLLDEFALVAPGQLRAPSQVTVLFDAGRAAPFSFGPNVNIESVSSVRAGNAINPDTLSIAGLTFGMLLIALVCVGGFTVVAQRRLRSLGMLASLGATDKNLGLVVRANGVVVGVVGSVLGAAVGFVLWLAYRPHLESSSHHLISVLALPWTVIALALLITVVATYLAASRPARAIAKVPIVLALSGRPAPPKQVRRSALPGLVFLALSFLLLGYSGSQDSWGHSGGQSELVLGLAVLIPAVILLAPFCLSVMARLGRRTPVPVRLALPRPRPLPGSFRVGSRGHKPRRAHRRHHHHRGRRPLCERPRLCRAKPGGQPAHRVHTQRPRLCTSGARPIRVGDAAASYGQKCQRHRHFARG